MIAGKKHIALLCSRLDLPGGIERAIVNTAGLFAEKGHRVTLVILDETADSFYPVHPAIWIVQQPLSFGITKEGNLITRKIRMLSDVLKLRKLLKETLPDFLIATEYPFAAAAILAGAGKRSNIASWEHHHLYELKRNIFWHKIFKFTYPRLDTIVCLNEDEKKLFEPVNHNPVVIPNFISPALSRSPLSSKMILTVARLAHVKGIDLLISTAKILFAKHPDWKWKVIGSNGKDNIVADVIRQEGLSNHLIIQAPVDHNIMPEYQNACMYVMTSRHECFPMTLLEAQSAGLPCIAFDCETGPRHIIRHDENGLLVEKENTLRMADAISSLIKDEEKRRKMGEKAWENISRFSPENIYALWKQVF